MRPVLQQVGDPGSIHLGRIGRREGLWRVRDGAEGRRNAVGFGDIPSGALAVTCSSFSGGSMLESDIRINKAALKWTTQADAPGCSNRFSATPSARAT